MAEKISAQSRYSSYGSYTCMY